MHPTAKQEVGFGEILDEFGFQPSRSRSDIDRRVLRTGGLGVGNIAGTCGALEGVLHGASDGRAGAGAENASEHKRRCSNSTS